MVTNLLIKQRTVERMAIPGTLNSTSDLAILVDSAKPLAAVKNETKLAVSTNTSRQVHLSYIID